MVVDLSLKIFGPWLKQPSRNFGITSILRNESASAAPAGHMHRPSNWDKRILVYSGKYKNVAEVPDSVPAAVMHKAKNKWRIKVNIWMCVACVAACVAMVYSGKAALGRGEVVSERTVQHHKELKEARKSLE
ncbi:unnamed protein product [Darwinula stevensoni]|uniref:Uncharacterized protein n=1 Tax=Darwinula stevensoni TaxID=69355 RepID=A0A7R8XIG2_9CRUS|nr:unnamed protein product [Darwinula stevensoni]CAG0893411.1 unnamed protein product [Darwinula stevensoni]